MADADPPASSDPAASTDPATSADPSEETKRKFREALERKKAKSAGGSEHRDGGGKQSHAHGPAGGRREFRRKSG